MTNFLKPQLTENLKRLLHILLRRTCASCVPPQHVGALSQGKIWSEKPNCPCAMQSCKCLHPVRIVFRDNKFDEHTCINDIANHRARSSRRNSRDKFNGFFQRSSNRSLIRVAAANTGSSATGVSSTSTRCPSGNPGDSSSSTTFPWIVPHAFIASPRIH